MAESKNKKQAAGSQSITDALSDSGLYSIGAYFTDRHPELLADVLQRSLEIEEQGITAYAESNDLTTDQTVQTLLTGLAVRYFKAVSG